MFKRLLGRTYLLFCDIDIQSNCTALKTERSHTSIFYIIIKIILPVSLKNRWPDHH